MYLTNMLKRNILEYLYFCQKHISSTETYNHIYGKLLNIYIITQNMYYIRVVAMYIVYIEFNTWRKKNLFTINFYGIIWKNIFIK